VRKVSIEFYYDELVNANLEFCLEETDEAAVELLVKRSKLSKVTLSCPLRYLVRFLACSISYLQNTTITNYLSYIFI
jgi:hypothetical protein